MESKRRGKKGLDVSPNIAALIFEEIKMACISNLHKYSSVKKQVKSCLSALKVAPLTT